jgi:hypothetical protein
MADGDVFRKLGRAYQKAYECLCEGKALTVSWNSKYSMIGSHHKHS